MMETTTERRRTYRVFDWVGRHARLVAFGALLAALTLGIVGTLVADTNDADFDPSGEVFDTSYEARDTLAGTSTISTATWVVEAADGGNVLSQASLAEWKAMSDAVRRDPAFAEHLVDRYDPDTGTTVPGLMSVADVVDSGLAGGLAMATEDDVASVLAAALADGSPFAEMRFTLSERAELTGDGWKAPAFLTTVVYDSAGFASMADEEMWLRDLQAELRDGAVATDALGVTIDPELSFGEAAEQSAPFIFLAVALIILLVAFVHRSFWSAVVVGTGLAATSLAYYGTSALLGLKMGSLLLAFIVPIAMISFGVDFYIHGLGRVREAQVEDGHDVARAYPFGMTAVFTAMLLAVSSSVAAFLSNAASGTEAIIQFGIGSAISLVWAYVLLGQIAPRVTVGLEDWVGDDPVKGLARYAYAAGAVVMAIIGGLTVALAAVMPIAGAIALVVFVALLVLLPAGLTRLRNRRAAARGRDLVDGHAGHAHGLRPAGIVVHFLAKWRVVTIPVVVLIGVLGYAQASTVESGFDIKDFLSSDTDFSRSIDRITEHFPSSGEGSAFVYLTGDLTDPDGLAAIDSLVDDLDGRPVDLGRNAGGDLLVGLHAADLVRMVMASPAAADIAASGPDLTDSDGDGLPDRAAAIAAIYRHAAENGVQTPDGAIAIAPEDVATVVAPIDGGYATAVTIQVGSFTDGTIIAPVEQALIDVAASYETATGIEARVSGDVLTSYHGMNAFTQSMLVSLPLALVLALLIAAMMLRSIRYAFVSVLPIGLVVVGVYAFMATFGYTVNVVTATIAAVAVGVGIDFSTHFTARYREELEGDGGRLGAVRRAGTGTGGALVLSALTSVLGFLVMAMAPTPIFATFGALTAVMIVLSLLVAVLVLPSLLVAVTPRHRDADAVVTELVPEPAPA